MLIDGKIYTTCLTCDKVKRVKDMVDYECSLCHSKTVKKLLNLPTPRHKDETRKTYKKKYRSGDFF